MHASLAVLLLAPTLALAACGSPDPAFPTDATTLDAATPDIDPDLVVSTAEESVRLADHRGEVLVLQIAPASDPDAWAALDDAHADLVAEGATVIGIVTDGRREGAAAYPIRHAESGPWAEALGYDGTAMAVVIGPAGRLRGRFRMATGDDIVALAAPVLLETDFGSPGIDAPPSLTATAVESLVRSGAALIDVRADGEPLANALAVPFARLSPDVLPPDTRAAIVFVGPDAERAAERASDWGYVAVYALLDAQGLEVIAPEEALPSYDPRDDLPRVRG